MCLCMCVPRVLDFNRINCYSNLLMDQNYIPSRYLSSPTNIGQDDIADKDIHNSDIPTQTKLRYCLSVEIIFDTVSVSHFNEINEMQ